MQSIKIQSCLEALEILAKSFDKQGQAAKTCHDKDANSFILAASCYSVAADMLREAMK